MSELEKKQRELAESILKDVKSRLYDMTEFKVKKIESEEAFLTHTSRSFISIELPNGDSISLHLFAKKVGA